MFGFLRPGVGDRLYRQYYAGCCSFQHRSFGIETLPLLSYEAVFLYLIAADAGVSSPPRSGDVTCCRLRRGGKRLHQVDDRLATFCTSFGLLLAGIKLEDDVRDERSLWARIVLWRLAARIERAKDFFATCDSRFRERLEGFLADHLRLERDGGCGTLAEYARPTADAFGFLFGLYARFVPAERANEPLLREMGAHVGRAIIYFDCAVDWQRDRRLGRFNPLADRAAVDAALLASQRSLAHLGWQCAEAFGPAARSCAVAKATFARVAGRTRRGAFADDVVSRRRMQWRPQRRGDCDCDCPGVELGLPICTCCECFNCCIICDTSPVKKNKQEPALSEEEKASWVGAIGHTLGPLAPSGVILVGEERLPARAEYGWIDNDRQVVVVKDGPFGVSVRELDAQDVEDI